MCFLFLKDFNPEVTFKLAAEKGNATAEACEGGDLILDVATCMFACELLEIPLSQPVTDFQDEQPCYFGWTAASSKQKKMNCNQNGKQGGHARVICMSKQ